MGFINLAHSFHMLAQIFVPLDGPAKAIEHYDKLLFLWKEADPGPEVDETQKRLAGLR